MKKLFCLALFLILSTGSVFAGNSQWGVQGNRIKVTYTLTSASALIKNGQGEIWAVDFQATSSNGSYTICDSTQAGACSTQGLGVVSEGAQSVSGNSYFRDYGDRPIQTSTGIYAIVTNGTLIVTYD